MHRKMYRDRYEKENTKPFAVQLISNNTKMVDLLKLQLEAAEISPLQSIEIRKDHATTRSRLDQHRNEQAHVAASYRYASMLPCSDELCSVRRLPSPSRGQFVSGSVMHDRSHGDGSDLRRVAEAPRFCIARRLGGGRGDRRKNSIRSASHGRATGAGVHEEMHVSECTKSPKKASREVRRYTCKNCRKITPHLAAISAAG